MMAITVAFRNTFTVVMLTTLSIFLTVPEWKLDVSAL